LVVLSRFEYTAYYSTFLACKILKVVREGGLARDHYH